MAARFWLVSAMALTASLAVTGAEAAKKGAKPPPPVAVGCSHPIAPFCIGVTTVKGTYAMFDAKPFIPPGIGITVWGKVTGMSPCGAAAISVTKWEPNKKIKCTR
jgi:hypothetical protein